VPVDRLID